MAYTIELSFDIRKLSSMNEICNKQRELASQYNCEMQYFMNEIEGKGRSTIRSDCIHVVIFDESHYNDFLKFIRVIYQNRCLYIECIYREDNSCNLIYVSKHYLKRMNKKDAKEIKKKYQKNKENITKQQFEILNIFRT